VHSGKGGEAKEEAEEWEVEDKEELEKVHEAATWRQQTKAEADAVERSLIKGGGGLKGGFRKGE